MRIFIDTSYLVYFTGFSTNYWAQRFGITNKHAYFNEFSRRFIRNIKEPMRKFAGNIDLSDVIFCKDCKRSDIWRRLIYPEYKVNYDNTTLARGMVSWGEIFDQAELIISEHRLAKHGYAEADDVIATLSRKYRGKSFILSSDRDFLQLSDVARLIDCKGDEKTINNDIGSANKDGRYVSPKQHIYMKAMIGDVSDNIPKIHKGVGKVTAFKYMSDYNLMRKKTSLTQRKMLARNIRIMDFDFIPNDLHDSILKTNSHLI